MRHANVSDTSIAIDFASPNDPYKYDAPNGSPVWMKSFHDCVDGGSLLLFSLNRLNVLRFLDARVLCNIISGDLIDNKTMRLKITDRPTSAFARTWIHEPDDPWVVQVKNIITEQTSLEKLTFFMTCMCNEFYPPP